MKSFMLGTQHHSVKETPQQLLLMVATKSFQRKSGYVPPVMPFDETILPTMPPVAEPFANFADLLMTELCERKVAGCNPRTPYLLLAWMLIGSDNPYRVNQFVDDDELMRHIARLLLEVATGELPDREKVRSIVSLATMRSSDAATPHAQRSDLAWAMARDVARVVQNTLYQSENSVIADIGWAIDAMVWEFSQIKWNMVRKYIRFYAMKWCFTPDSRASHTIQSLFIDTLPVFTY